MKELIRKYTGFMLLLVMALFDTSLMGQATIDNVDFYLEGEKLYITYDIIKSRKGEEYKVWINVRTSQGPVSANALSGDVGNKVSGGIRKLIIWDMTKDNFYGDPELQIEVYAQKETSQKVKEEKKKKGKKPSPGGIRVEKAVMYSVLLPGLGNNYTKGGGAYWIIGVAGYGALAGSIYMNSAASNSLDDYRAAKTKSARDDFFSEAENKDQLSKILFGAAAAIWVGDIIWTIAQASSEKKKQARDLSLGVDYFQNYQVKMPVVKLCYRF